MCNVPQATLGILLSLNVKHADSHYMLDLSWSWQTLGSLEFSK